MKKRIPFVLKIVLILLSLIIIGTLTAFFVFRIKDITIVGNSRVSEEEVKQEIKLEKAKGNSLLLLLLNRNTDYTDNDMIRNIEISLSSPTQVKVTVLEQSLIGCLQTKGGYTYFNRSGLCILNEKNAEDGIPVVSGPDIKSAEIGSMIETSDDVVMGNLIDIAAFMCDYDAPIDSLEASDGKYFAYYKDVTINLGRYAYMTEKISELASLLGSIKDLSGTLHLENYESGNNSIVFTKDERQLAREESETDEQMSVSDTDISLDYSDDDTYNDDSDGSDDYYDDGSYDGSDDYYDDGSYDENRDDSAGSDDYYDDGSYDENWDDSYNSDDYYDDGGYDYNPDDYYDDGEENY